MSRLTRIHLHDNWRHFVFQWDSSISSNGGHNVMENRRCLSHIFLILRNAFWFLMLLEISESRWLAHHEDKFMLARKRHVVLLRNKKSYQTLPGQSTTDRNRINLPNYFLVSIRRTGVLLCVHRRRAIYYPWLRKIMQTTKYIKLYSIYCEIC